METQMHLAGQIPNSDHQEVPSPSISSLNDINHDHKDSEKTLYITNAKRTIIKSGELDPTKSPLHPKTQFQYFILFLKYFFCFMQVDDFKDATKTGVNRLNIFAHRAQIRLIYPSILALLLISLANGDKVGLSQTVTLFGSAFVSAIAFAMLGFIFLKHCSTGTNVYKLINYALGIPFTCTPNKLSVDTLFDLDRTYWGMKYIILVLICGINNILVFSVFYLSTAELEQGCLDENDADKYGKCAVNQSTILQIYVITYAIFIAAASYYHVNPRFAQEMDVFFGAQHSRDRPVPPSYLLSHNIEQVRDDIQMRLKNEWRPTKFVSNRKLELLATFIIFLGFHIFVLGSARNDIFSGKASAVTTAFCMFLYVVESLCITAVAKDVFELLYHVQFPRHIMIFLGEQFEACSMDDIVSWWRLRKFYLECVIDIYASNISAFIAAGLTGFTILAVFSFLWTDDDGELIRNIFRSFAGIVIALTLLFTSTAVNIYSTQLSHVHTLNKEMMKMEYMDNVQEKDPVVFDRIVADVENNSQPIRVFGIKMNQEFLIFLQTTTLSVALAAAFS